MRAVKQALVRMNQLKIVARQIASPMKALCLADRAWPYQIQPFAVAITWFAKKHGTPAVGIGNAPLHQRLTRSPEVIRIVIPATLPSGQGASQ